MPEVWRWIEDRFWIYGLVNGRYHERAASKIAPKLDLRRLARFITTTDEEDQTEAVRAFRQSLRRRR